MSPRPGYPIAAVAFSLALTGCSLDTHRPDCANDVCGLEAQARAERSLRAQAEREAKARKVREQTDADIRKLEAAEAEEAYEQRRREDPDGVRREEDFAKFAWVPSLKRWPRNAFGCRLGSVTVKDLPAEAVAKSWLPPGVNPLLCVPPPGAERNAPWNTGATDSTAYKYYEAAMADQMALDSGVVNPLGCPAGTVPSRTTGGCISYTGLPIGR